MLAALAVVCVLHLRRIGRPSAPTVGALAVAVAGLISVVAATLRGMVDPVDAVLYAVRPLEYWIAFPAALLVVRGASARWRGRFELVLAITTVLQAVFAILQYYAGIPIGFSHAAYSRAAGLTVGPYELGAISSALVVFWIARGRWTLASLAAVALAASISRISILGAAAAVVVLAVGWAVAAYRRSRTVGWRRAVLSGHRSRPVLIGHLLSVGAAGLVLAFTLGLIHLPAPAVTAAPAAGASAAPEPSVEDAEPTVVPRTAAPQPSAAPAPVPLPKAPSDSIARRLESTSVLGSWRTAAVLADRAPVPKDGGEYRAEAYDHLTQFVDVNAASSSGVDASNLIRFFRWNLILNTIDDPADVVFGLGPSFVGPSVDGSYLRIYAEGGLLGVLAWLVLVLAWVRRMPLWMVGVTVATLIGAVFIDVLYAERPMVLFWALLAFATSGRRVAGDHSPAGREQPASR